MSNFDDQLDQVDQLLNLPRQIWLLGAGISKEAGVPLMWTLTERVESALEGTIQEQFQLIRNSLKEEANVEDVLSQIGDLIAISKRNQSETAIVDGHELDVAHLEDLHSTVQKRIYETVRFGYREAQGGQDEEVGTPEQPIVRIQDHLEFVSALFHTQRAGLEQRPPVQFYTTNYDTLLEDALALARIRTRDWFSGGTMAFWDPRKVHAPEEALDPGDQAVLHKLHGSVDWYMSEEDIVVRRREGAAYPPGAEDRLLIYPQATKYQLAQRDPFASLFAAFRQALRTTESALLAVCGYSFRDEHINQEIELAMKERGNTLTLLIFIREFDNTEEDESGLPTSISRWLSTENSDWRDRIVVASDRGLYIGSLENLWPDQVEDEIGWWSFQGLTKFIDHGPEALK